MAAFSTEYFLQLYALLTISRFCAALFLDPRYFTVAFHIEDIDRRFTL